MSVDSGTKFSIKSEIEKFDEGVDVFVYTCSANVELMFVVLPCIRFSVFNITNCSGA